MKRKILKRRKDGHKQHYWVDPKKATKRMPFFKSTDWKGLAKRQATSKDQLTHRDVFESMNVEQALREAQNKGVRFRPGQAARIKRAIDEGRFPVAYELLPSPAKSFVNVAKDSASSVYALQQARTTEDRPEPLPPRKRDEKKAMYNKLLKEGDAALMAGNKELAQQKYDEARNYGAAPSRYTTSSGRFRKMTDPDGKNKRKTRFQGCERSMRARGYGGKASTRICASIARRKK